MGFSLSRRTYKVANQVLAALQTAKKWPKKKKKVDMKNHLVYLGASANARSCCGCLQKKLNLQESPARKPSCQAEKDLMRNAYEKLMVDPVGVVGVGAPWSIITLECAADHLIKPFDGMQNTRNGP